MSTKSLYGIFDDDHKLLHAAKAIVAEGVHVRDVFSPFPVHGIDPVIGLKRTRIAITAFIYGCIGLSLALIGIRYFMIVDWPMNIGGKPSYGFLYNLPAFVPVLFEFTVFCACHGMALTYFLRNKTLPGMKARNPFPETTDHHFAMELNSEDNPNHSNEELSALLKRNGVIEVK